ncbi:MAG TPA: cation diffusion facilitator family transporter [Thermoanaerobaculia bacterium]
MGHSHNHSHAHARNITISRKLVIATAANALVVIGELWAGIYAGSLALIGDALHNLADVTALLIALFAVRLERRPPTSEKSFGYQRAGVLAAFINAGLLAAFALFIFSEAWERFQDPRDVHMPAMLIAATIALIVNSGTALLIVRESRDDVNVRGAMMHMIGDAASSAGIIVAALLIHVTGSAVWDAAVSVLIGLLILWTSYGILRESVNLLLEGTPAGINPQAVIASLGSIEGIHGVHHLHIWAIGPSSSALSCHLMVGDVPLRSTARLLDEVNAMLAREHRIVHTTIQFEFAECEAEDPYCTPFRH